MGSFGRVHVPRRANAPKNLVPRRCSIASVVVVSVLSFFNLCFCSRSISSTSFIIFIFIVITNKKHRRRRQNGIQEERVDFTGRVAPNALLASYPRCELVHAVRPTRTEI